MNEQNNSQSNVTTQNQKNIWIVVAVVISTALVVGASVYAWQKNEANKINNQVAEAQKITNEQAEQIIKLEGEIAELKNQPAVANDGKTTTAVGELADWKTYVNKKDGYSIMHPAEFWPQYDDDIMNYDIDDPRYAHGNPGGIKIQINKIPLDPDFKSFDEYIAYENKFPDGIVEPTKPVKLGDFISLSRYTKEGAGGAFMEYTAFNEHSDDYLFKILVFEPGYSYNKELIEKIVSTFKIL